MFWGVAGDTQRRQFLPAILPATEGAGRMRARAAGTTSLLSPETFLSMYPPSDRHPGWSRSTGRRRAASKQARVPSHFAAGDPPGRSQAPESRGGLPSVLRRSGEGEGSLVLGRGDATPHDHEDPRNGRADRDCPRTRSSRSSSWAKLGASASALIAELRERRTR